MNTFSLILARIIEKNGGKPPLTYKSFQNILMNMDLPPLPQGTITSEEVEDKQTPISDDHDEKYGVPSLEELGELGGTAEGERQKERGIDGRGGVSERDFTVWTFHLLLI